MSLLKRLNPYESELVRVRLNRKRQGDLYSVGLNGLIEVVEYPDCLWIENIDGRSLVNLETLNAIKSLASGRPISALCRSKSRVRLFRRVGFVESENGRITFPSQHN